MGTINSFNFRAAAAGDRVSACRIVFDRLRLREHEHENNIMTKVEAVIQNSKLEAVKSALHEIGVEGMTVLEVRGHGRQKGHTEVYRGREYSVDLIPKTKLEMVLADAMVEKAVQAILVSARTGKIGDGKIFLTRVDEAIRIRNEERGEGAL
jgi:nitrogen regulatory protein P-II 1